MYKKFGAHFEDFSALIRPYSHDLSDLQENFERELYVNKRTLTTSPSYLTQSLMISDLSTQWQLS